MILAVAAASTVASAGTINTGVDATNTILAPGSPEIHFTLTSQPGSGQTLSSVPLLPSADYYHTGSNIGTSTADWIWGSLGFAAPAGIYVFTETIVGYTTFDAIWATDNCGSVTSSAGTLTGTTSIGAGQTVGTCDGSNSANFGSHTFTATGLNPAGTTLTFTLVNTDGPVSLLVDAGSGTPEPASILSVITGLGLVGLGIRRRKTAK